MGLTILESDIENVNKIDEPIKEKYEVEIKNQVTAINDLLYINPMLYEQLKEEELEKIKGLLGEERYNLGRFTEAAEIFDHLVKTEDFIDFLTLKAYDSLA